MLAGSSSPLTGRKKKKETEIEMRQRKITEIWRQEKRKVETKRKTKNLRVKDRGKKAEEAG